RTRSGLAAQGDRDAAVRTPADAGRCRCGGGVFRVGRERPRHRRGARPRAVPRRRTAELVSVMPPRISVFPKCYFDALVEGRMPYEGWIRDAATLGGEGIEHYDEFFRSLAAEHVDPIVHVMRETRQISSMLCFSPDFTHADPDERQRQV